MTISKLLFSAAAFALNMAKIDAAKPEAPVPPKKSDS